jgi:hypothetical protein
MNRWRLISGLVFAGALPACGSAESTRGGSPPAGAPDLAATADARNSVLASIDVGYGTVEFSKSPLPNGHAAFAILEKASAFLRTTPMVTLMSSRSLTTLEVFLAVAPGRRPPQELVDLHTEQALRLGRATRDIVHATFDRNAPVEKSAAACDGWVYAPRADCELWGNRLGIDFTTGTPTAWLNVGSTEFNYEYQTMAFAALGVCNETDAASAGADHVWARYATRVDLGGAWSYADWVNLPVGIYARWWIDVARFGPEQCGIASCPHPASYAVQGWSLSDSPVDLRTAEEFPDTNCVR